jgi:hypothetical protein
MKKVKGTREVSESCEGAGRKNSIWGGPSSNGTMLIALAQFQNREPPFIIVDSDRVTLTHDWSAQRMTH